MKRFSFGLLVGFLVGLVLASTSFALADQPIRLIVNGKEIQCDVPPQLINGRVLVPARFVAEPLGARVEWDEAKKAIVVTSDIQQDSQPIKTNKLSINGQLTDFPYWEKNGDVFLPVSPVVDMVYKQHSGRLFFRVNDGPFVKKQDRGFYVDNKLIEPLTIIGGRSTLNISSIKRKGYVDFTWDKGNLIYDYDHDFD